MIDNNYDLSRHGSTVEDAVSFYRGLIESNKLGRHTVEGWGDVYFKYLSDPEGWLGVWMLRADELAVSLIGCRIWDVAYIRDSQCVQAIRPVSIKSLSSPQNQETLSTYLRYPLADSMSIPGSLLLTILNSSFQESLVINGMEVNIKQVTGFYDIGDKFSDQDILPFQDDAKISAVYLNRFIIESNASNGMSINLDNGASIE